ncbi:MAG TPA: nucleotidyltransferase family protein [Sedimentisphaerales bacterium]|nr:nucleotidyltransferase family protein [Sedimentisphaerales bacterium]
MKGNPFHAWLLALSDPDGRRALPSHPLAVGRWVALWERADYHGVLPAAVANARRILTTLGGDGLAAMEASLPGVRNRLIGRAALSLAIRSQIRQIADEFQAHAVPAAVLKGADFADRLYPDPSLRPFTDLDLLVPEQRVAEAEAAMSRLGYTPCEASMKYHGGYGERSWVRPNRREGTVEIHWNLVNSPTIRRGVSVAWEDLAFEDGPGTDDSLCRPTPPARLLIAAVHAAASHGFDRLGPLHDVCLAARRCESPADGQWLAQASRRTGAELSLAVSLALARRLFDEPACSRLQAAMRLPRRGAWSLLLTPGVVLRGHRRLDSPRRQLFRELLKRRCRSCS